MGQLDEVRVSCPYCGAGFVALVDTSVDDQYYIEDCRACCSPINFAVSLDDGEPRVRTTRDDE